MGGRSMSCVEDGGLGLRDSPMGYYSEKLKITMPGLPGAAVPKEPQNEFVYAMQTEVLGCFDSVSAYQAEPVEPVISRDLLEYHGDETVILGGGDAAWIPVQRLRGSQEQKMTNIEAVLPLTDPDVLGPAQIFQKRVFSSFQGQKRVFMSQNSGNALEK